MNQREQVQSFLDIYKRLEGLIGANHGQSVLDYEHMQESADISKKLQICRILRNYVQHNEDGYAFVSISGDMIKFLEHLCMMEEASVSKNEDLMERPYTKKLTDKVLPAAKTLGAKDIRCVPILDENRRLAGILTKEAMIRIACSHPLDGLTFAEVRKLIKPDFDRILFVGPKGRAEETILTGEGFDLVLVTADGTRKGKVMGTITMKGGK